MIRIIALGVVPFALLWADLRLGFDVQLLEQPNADSQPADGSLDSIWRDAPANTEQIGDPHDRQGSPW